jgi:methionyl-tRNA formyltransferase
MRERITGGMVYWMEDGADTGPIEAQEFCHILPGEIPTELWRRALAPLGVRLLTEVAVALARGKQPNRAPQDERVDMFEPAFTGRQLSQDNAQAKGNLC